MSDHPNAARYRQLQDAMNAGDMSVMADSIADDIEWWEIGAPEPVRGKAALVERMQWFGDYEITTELHDVIANDDGFALVYGATDAPALAV